VTEEESMSEFKISNDTSLYTSMGEEGSILQGVVWISIEKFRRRGYKGLALSWMISSIEDVAECTCIERE
jgi:hypothetical protein